VVVLFVITVGNASEIFKDKNFVLLSDIEVS